MIKGSRHLEQFWINRVSSPQGNENILLIAGGYSKLTFQNKLYGYISQEQYKVGLTPEMYSCKNPHFLRGNLEKTN